MLLALALLASTAVFAEFGQRACWWQNNGKVPAILYAAGILPAAIDDDTM